MFKVYIDESGTHDGSPVVTVAAYLARPGQWQGFTRAWRQAIKPAKVYHATDAANLRGEFRNWTSEQVAEVASRALPLIPKHTQLGLACGMNLDDYAAIMVGRDDLKAAIGRPYCLCLHWVMQTFLSYKASVGNKDRIAFFHETNDFARDAYEAFRHMEQHWNPHGARMSFTFVAKDQYVPLQAADALAYEANKRIRKSASPLRRALGALNPGDGRLQLRFYDRDNFPDFVRILESVDDSDGPLSSILPA